MFHKDLPWFERVYWCNGIKKGIVEFVAKCPNCKQVQVEYQNLELPIEYKFSGVEVGYD